MTSSVENLENRFNNNNLPTISAFPKDEKNWRIDWFGEIAFPNRLIRRRQPSVLVHLSRVISDRYEENPIVLLSPDSTSPARFQRKVWISIGTLPMLRIGDIWRNGQLVSQPDYELEEFPNILINRDTTHLVKAGLNLNDKGFLLPLAEHPWHMHSTQSYCVLVELADNRRLIVPCIELVRFYFGSSSNLIAKLFQPPLERKSLYHNAQYDKSSGRLTLELAEHISGTSAADIARIHQSKAAWHAAVQISTSILAASLNKQEIHPQALFPFEGFTNLVAVGKWLSFEDNPRATFIVFNLRSCSHPFPFRSLRYIAPNRQRDSSSLEKDSSNTSSQTRTAAKDSANQNLIERDASNSLTKKIKRARAPTRFLDLIKKSIWHDILLKNSNEATGKYGSAKHSVSSTSFGEPGSEQRVRPIDLALTLCPQRLAKKPIPKFLTEAVAELKQLTEQVELLTESEEDGWSIPISIICDEDGEIDPKFFLCDQVTNKLRERRVSVFLISRSNGSFTATYIESDTTKIYVHEVEFPLIFELDRVLSMSAGNFVFNDGHSYASLKEFFENRPIGNC